MRKQQLFIKNDFQLQYQDESYDSVSIQTTLASSKAPISHTTQNSFHYHHKSNPRGITEILESDETTIAEDSIHAIVRRGALSSQHSPAKGAKQERLFTKPSKQTEVLKAMAFIGTKSRSNARGNIYQEESGALGKEKTMPSQRVATTNGVIKERNSIMGKKSDMKIQDEDFERGEQLSQVPSLSNLKQLPMTALNQQRQIRQQTSLQSLHSFETASYSTSTTPSSVMNRRQVQKPSSQFLHSTFNRSDSTEQQHLSTSQNRSNLSSRFGMLKTSTFKEIQENQLPQTLNKFVAPQSISLPKTSTQALRSFVQTEQAPIKDQGIDFTKRPKNGKFEQIFPFNKTSEDLAVQLNKSCNSTSGGSSVMMGGPNFMKLLISEIKKWETEYTDHVHSMQNPTKSKI